MAAQRPEIDRYGRFVDTHSGLLVPETYQRNAGASMLAQFEGDSPLNKGDGFAQGLRLARDENTLAVRFPRKGSGFDDYISQAIVDGRVANVGASPVVAPQISAMVRRQQNQAISATIDVTGRPTPAGKATEAIAHFNDSPLGVNAALELIVYRLCTFNRGAPVATVPISYDFDDWPEYGLIAHPILARNQKEENATRFWLEVDWSRFGTPVPFLPHPLDLEATGDVRYPYWYHATRADGKRVWVLLSAEQIVPLVPGNSVAPGIGTSPTWICLGYLAEQILITEERVEKMLYALTDGIVVLGGVNITGQQIEDRVAEARQARIEEGLKAAKGVAIFSSPLDKVSYIQIPLRQPPGIEFKEWREWCEDVIAFSFGEPLSSLVIRGGVGFGAQADAAAENVAETGIGAHLARLGGVLGSIYPRVMITVSRANDRAARMNVKTFAQFAGGAAQMIDKGVLTPQQVTTIIDRDIMTLPETGDVTASANPDDNEEDVADVTADDGQTSQDKTASPAAAAPKQPYFNSAALRPAIDDETLAMLRALDTLYDDGDVVITTEDEERAYQLARRRVNQDVFELLTAETVAD